LAKKLNVTSADSKKVLLIGIASLATDYRLLYFIDNLLGFSFIKRNDLPLYGKKDKLGDFSFYEYLCTEKHLHYFLIANKSENQIAIPAYRNFDYFLLIEGSLTADAFQNMLRRLRSVALIQAAMNIPTSSVKDLDLLLEDLELHLIALQKSARDKRSLWPDILYQQSHEKENF